MTNWCKNVKTGIKKWKIKSQTVEKMTLYLIKILQICEKPTSSSKNARHFSKNAQTYKIIIS